MATGTIKRNAVNVEYTSINSYLAYEIKNDIVFVHIINFTASPTTWSSVGTIPSEYSPSIAIYSAGPAGAYGNSYWGAVQVATDGKVTVGSNSTGNYANLNCTISYPL